MRVLIFHVAAAFFLHRARENVIPFEIYFIENSVTTDFSFRIRDGYCSTYIPRGFICPAFFKHIIRQRGVFSISQLTIKLSRIAIHQDVHPHIPNTLFIFRIRESDRCVRSRDPSAIYTYIFKTRNLKRKRCVLPWRIISFRKKIFKK